METQIACPDCGESMEAGYVPDVHGTTMVQSAWISGIPVTGMFGGVQDLSAYNRRLPIITYRCKNCGLLKSYARADPNE